MSYNYDIIFTFSYKYFNRNRKAEDSSLLDCDKVSMGPWILAFQGL
jgi:hypothetical protein